MPNTTPSAQRATFARCTGYAAAAGLAWYALASGAVSNSAVPLFGWPRLIVVQVLMGLPLAILAATFVQRKVAAEQRRSLAIVGVAAGMLATLLVAILVPTLGRAMENGGLGFWSLVPIRALLCLAVELPWCAAGECFVDRQQKLVGASPHANARRRIAIWATLAAAVAIALPAVYSDDLARKQTALASDLLARQQLVAADRVVARLCALGSHRPLRGAEPAIVARKLARTIATLTERVKRTNVETLDADQTVELARTLAMLDHLAEAQATLAPLADTRADAAILSAAIMQEQGAWEASRARFAAAADLLRDTSDSRQQTAGLVQAINGIAYNERELGNFRAAQQAYEAGLRELPDAAAHFHFQLGRHHQLGGRPIAAVAHLQEAAALDPQGFGAQAAALVRQLSAGTPGCLLGVPRIKNK